jgi:general secretion pathway protein G
MIGHPRPLMCAIRNSGFSLLELIIAVSFAALLMAIAVPSYMQYADRARISRAIGDIPTLDIEIERFRLKNQDRIPNSLAEVGTSLTIDPWGRPYQFLNIRNVVGKGPLRKDGKLNPLNTDYDLYSIGKDGQTATPLSAMASRDDIVRANNGAFVGLGEDY